MRGCYPKCQTVPIGNDCGFGAAVQSLICCIRVELDYVCWPSGDLVSVHFQEITECGVTVGDVCDEDNLWIAYPQPGDCDHPTDLLSDRYIAIQDLNWFRILPEPFTNLHGIARCWGYANPDGSLDTVNVDCMNVIAGDGESAYGIVQLEWKLNCSTGQVDFVLRGSYNPAHTSGIVATGSFPQDWYLADIELTPVDPRASNVIVSTSCATTIPCESLDCFPDCISNTEECDGVTATHVNLFIDIGLNGADGFETMGWDELNNEYNAGPILTADETMGSYFESVSFRLRCNGGQPELRVLRRVWHSYDAYDQTFVEYNGPISIECVGGEVTITDGGYTIFSNNNGLL